MYTSTQNEQNFSEAQIMGAEYSEININTKYQTTNQIITHARYGQF